LEQDTARIVAFLAHHLPEVSPRPVLRINKKIRDAWDGVDPITGPGCPRPDGPLCGLGRLRYEYDKVLVIIREYISTKRREGRRRSASAARPAPARARVPGRAAAPAAANGRPTPSGTEAPRHPEAPQPEAPAVPAVRSDAPGDHEAETHRPDLVTLSQAAGMVHKTKRTLERWKTQGKLPDPAVEGGGGKADLWDWKTLRPVL
jgi:hypothetical protein